VLATDIRRPSRALRSDPLHVRESVLAGAGPPGCLSRCRHPKWCPRAIDGIRASFREQLLLRDHAAGRKPECHLRRQRLPYATRTLPARTPHNTLLLAGVHGGRYRMDPLGDPSLMPFIVEHDVD